MLSAARRPGDPPVLAAVVAATPRRPFRRDVRGRPAGCPEAVRDRPAAHSRSTVGTGVEGLASKRLQPVQPGGLMEIVVRGRNVEVPEHFRQHVGTRSVSSDRFDGKLKIAPHRRGAVPREEPAPVGATASAWRSPSAARARSSGPRPAAPDFYAALDLAAGKLENRLRRAADRRRVHHGRRTPASVRLTGNTAAGRCAAADALDLDRQLGRGAARHRPRRAPARPGRAGEAPPRHPDDRRPGPPRDGTGRPRLLPLPVRRHRPARRSSTAGTPTTTASSG